MITHECDNCEKLFQVDDDAAGEKVACPYCGDVNRIISRVETTGPVNQPHAPSTANNADPARAEAGESSSASDRDAASSVASERPLVVVRTAMFRGRPFLYSLMVLLFLSGVGVGIYGLAAEPAYQWLRWLGLGIAVVGALWWFGWWIAPHRWIKLTITNKRSILQEGIVMRRTSEVLHNHIRNVKIEQNVLQRILGVGDISIDAAGGSEEGLVEIHMKCIPSPYRVKQIIDQYRRM